MLLSAHAAAVVAPGAAAAAPGALILAYELIPAHKNPP
jgi:hypothetical protein